MQFQSIENHEAILFSAIAVGVSAALVTTVFKVALDISGYAIFGSHADVVQEFASLAWAWRIVIPTLGGIVAGTLLLAAVRLNTGKDGVTDYMEAVTIGGGRLPVRITLLRALASFCSIVAGSSVGKEGAMIQLAALCGAAFLPARCRVQANRGAMLTACGAAAGLASVYHTPLSAAVFVAEVVFGAVAVQRLMPLFIASVSATVISQLHGGAQPLYPGLNLPPDLLQPKMLLASALVGAFSGVAGAFFMHASAYTKAAFTRVPGGLVPRLALGGALVGMLAIWVPEVVGNGYSTIASILQLHPLSVSLAGVLLAKLLATILSVGSGAVGGVFTPSLFIGAALGRLLAPAMPGSDGALLLPLVGMAAFLAATSQAPLMSVLMVFEMTLAPTLLLPGMIGAVAAYYTASRCQALSLYSVVAERMQASVAVERARMLTVAGLCEPTDTTIGAEATLMDANEKFAETGTRYLYVTGRSGCLLGTLCIHTVQRALREQRRADIGGLWEENFPILTRESRLPDALRLFADHALNRIPLISDTTGRKLLGVVYRRRVVQEASCMF
ncbi:chloride channel protein [Burkholderia diffusa]|uniref:ClcB-like voltage-gated chloride channel protein n=1 Tax=Burkholderia diffusa TaxID=488732 RepID=UPI00075B9FDE|nr:ClcB-like voltage-gated chloride channel protein [Burkholderia diffusa]KWF94614.1 chloride channel protein [Burkholderia diffusa]